MNHTTIGFMRFIRRSSISCMIHCMVHNGGHRGGEGAMENEGAVQGSPARDVVVVQVVQVACRGPKFTVHHIFVF